MLVFAMRGYENLQATATSYRDSSRGAPILIVDGAAVDLKFMRLLLTYEGYAVRTTASAEEALRLLADLRPELVITDIRLPGIDGLELARRIKQDPRSARIKVMALTNRTAGGEEQQALAAGCDGCIPKPVETTVLTARLRQMLHRPAPLPALPAPGLGPAPLRPIPKHVANGLRGKAIALVGFPRTHTAFLGSTLGEVHARPCSSRSLRTRLPSPGRIAT